jgi:hypothetical protein
VATTSNGNVIIGTWDRGIFCSYDHGLHWEALNAGFRGTIWPTYENYPTVTRLIVDENDYVYVGTHGSCVYKSILPLASDENHLPKQVPTSFTLHQNYPNPFNPSTTIAFELNKQAKVKLAVFDIIGRQVATLFDGITTVGQHEIIFDGSGLASGLYFCRLMVDGNTQTRKMILLK